MEVYTKKRRSLETREKKKIQGKINPAEYRGIRRFSPTYT
jgi:hypothetical protein